MTPDAEATHSALRWTQRDLAVRDYELRAPHDFVIACLRFAPASGVAWELRDPKPAVIEDGASSWNLSVRRSGWAGALGWSATVAIAGPQTGELVAGSFLTAGQLTLEKQLSFIWRSSLVRGASSAFLSATSQPIVVFEPGSCLDRVNTVARLDRSTLTPPQGLLLLGLGLYLRLLMGRPFR